MNAPVTTKTALVSTDAGTTPVSYFEHGQGHPFVVLHGGAGSNSVREFVKLLVTTRHARVIAPIHPGFDGTPRPSALTTIKDLAAVHLALIEKLDLHDVTVVGNSVGGWTAAEMALALNSRISSVVLVNAVGLIIEDDPTKDFFSLTMDEVTDISYYNPDHYRLDTSALPAAVQQNMVSNKATLRALSGVQMGDRTLLGRLAKITAPVLVVWGAADAMVPISHGRRYATAIPGARLDVIANAGHLPQVETPDRLVHDVWEFADAHATMRPQR